jgi:hypothetical protein
MSEHRRNDATEQAQAVRSRLLADGCYTFVKALLVELYQVLDRRLVVTCLALIEALVVHRQRQQGLLLSELGAYLASPAHAPAGTKRISRLIHAPAWSVEWVLRFLWQRADETVQRLAQQAETVLCLWDESVLEKPESLALGGLSPVRSRKAARLKRIKPGFYNPPGGRPIFVPGWNWLAVLVCGLRGPVTLATVRWWATRGPQTSDKRTEEEAVLAETQRRWGWRLVHVWDRGFAGQPWLDAAFRQSARFVLRWPKRYTLLNLHGEKRPAWQLTRGLRSWEHRLLWDARRRCERKTGVLAVPVYDGERHPNLWLVVARSGKGREPWYLLTNEPITCAADAWRVVFIYARRWQVEMAIRFNKCELGMESPRLRSWDSCRKLLGLLTVTYAFLLTLLAPALNALCTWLLRMGCHRTGQRGRDCSTPLYRLRLALATLWLAHPPPLLRPLSSG